MSLFNDRSNKKVQKKRPVRNLMKKVYRKRPWNRAVTFTAATLVFITVYMLVLPAITMTKSVLDCPYVTYQDQEAVILHQHDAACYNDDGELICTLPERKIHVHDDSCYEEVILGYETIPLAQALEEGRLDGAAVFETAENALFYDSAAAGEITAAVDAADEVPDAAPAQMDDAVSPDMIFADSESSVDSAAVSDSGSIAQLSGDSVPTVDAQNPDYSIGGALDSLQYTQISQDDDESQMVTVPIIEERLICGREELNPELHVHDDSCYEIVITQNEDGSVTEGRILTCTKPVAFFHQHGEECFRSEESDDIIIYDENEQAMPGFSENGQEIIVYDEPQDNNNAEDPAEDHSQNTDDFNTTENVQPADVSQISDDSHANDDTKVVEVLQDVVFVDNDDDQADEQEDSGIIEYFEPITITWKEHSDTENEAGEKQADVKVENSTVPGESITATEQNIAEIPNAEEAPKGPAPVTNEEAAVEVTTEMTTETAAESATEVAAEEAVVEIPAEVTTETSVESTSEVTTEEAAVENAVENPTEVATGNATEIPTEVTTETASEVTSFAVSEEEENSTEAAADDAEEEDSEEDNDDSAEITTEAEITAEASTELSSKTVTEATTEFISETSSETVTETATEFTSEISSEGASEITSESVSEVSYEASAETTTDFFSESSSEALTETTTELFSESSSETTTETTTELLSESFSETPAEVTTAVLTFDGADYHVRLTYDSNSGISKDARLSVVEIDPESEEYKLYLDQAKAAIGLAEDISLPKEYARFFDITILDKEGNEIQPDNQVKVEIIYDQPVADIEDENVNASVLHFDEEKNAEVLSTLESGAEEGVEVSMEGNGNSSDTSNETGSHGGAEPAEGSDFVYSSDHFTSDEGSIAASESESGAVEEAARKDVDTYIINEGNTAASFEDDNDNAEADEAALAETVETADKGIAFTTDSFSVFGIIYTVDFHWEVNGKMYNFNIPGGGFVSFRKLVEELGISGDISDEGNGTDIEEFIADVENLEFSDPELVWTGKVYEETTVGSLKAQNNLTCEYSAELTEEDIEKINSTKIQSDDWVLIPRKPFKSEESLTVTMKNGEQFVIRVTDAQIQKTVITASGDTFKVTVTYDDTAEIPDGSELEADEILPGSEKYDELLDAASEALGTSAKNIEHIRFFDIKIKNGGEIIEPQNAVTVDIRYQKPVSCDESQDFNVIHFGSERTDVVVPEYTVDEEDQTTREFSFQTESFSTFAITSIVNTNDISQLIGNEYVLCITKNNGTGAVLSPEEYIATRNNRTYTNLKSIPVTINGTRITADNVDTLPVWTITKHSTNNTYSLSTTYNNQTVYVNFGNSNNSPVTVSTTPQYLRILRRDSPNGGSQYRFAYDNDAQNPSLDLFYGETDQGFSVYSGDNNNDNEYFNLYTVGEVAPNRVTVHFVDRRGTLLTDVQYTGGTYPPYLHRNDDGTFTIDYNWEGTTGSISLNTQFAKTRYTYANTHLAKNTTAEWPTVALDHTSDGIIIEPTLTSTGHALQFNTDIGGSGTGEGQVSSHDFYEAFSAAPPNGDNREYAAEGDKDVYVIMDPIPSASGTGGSGSSSSDPFANSDPIFHKDLANNHDGTYELSLSVVGKALNESETPKVNVLLVVDTSSSMVEPRNNVSYVNDEGNTVTGTRLEATQVQLRKLGKQLLSRNSQTNEDEKDIVDLAMITFDGDPHPDTLDWTNSYDTYKSAVDGLITHRGTYWEGALDAALDKALTMKAAQPNEPVYVLFFTDGEPSQYRSFHFTNDNDYGWRYFFAQYGKEASKDEARAIVNNGIQLYTMFAFGPTAANQPTYYGDTQFQLLHKLVQYAYNTTDNLVDKRAFNATNSAVLESAFNAILHEIDSSLGITNVEMNDSFTDLTVAGINNVGVGMVGTGGFRYWTIPEGGTWENRVTWDDAPKAEIDNGSVKWDLGNTVLQNNVTYVLTFTVWPSQAAYDWVADLNNGVKTWADVVAANLQNQIYRVYNDDGDLVGYEVQTNPQSSVNVDEETGNVTSSVNGISYKKTTEQTVTEQGTGGTNKYWNADHTAYIIETTSYSANGDGTYTKKVESTVYTSFNMPDKRMALEDTDFYVEKEWKVNGKLTELHNFLYHREGNEWVSNKKKVIFRISKGYDDDGDPLPYDKFGTDGLELGWQEPDGEVGAYDWYGSTTLIEGHPIGTFWREKLDISFGLMLTETQFVARGLDPSNTDYKSTVYNGVKYYLLDYGWDYAIDEIIGLNYQFDYRTNVYHPMLIDGKPADVKFTVENGVWTITEMKKDLTALTGTNILRGDLMLQKELLGIDGARVEDENTTFDFTVNLTNSDPVFIPDEGVETVPWYGVWKTTGGVTQSYFYQYAPGGVFDHYATEEEATMPKPDGSRELKDGYIGNVMEYGGTPTTVTYNDAECTGYTQAYATIHIKAGEEWSIANIPLETKVTVGEPDKTGYEFVSAKIDNNPVVTTIVDGKHTTPEYTIPAGTTTTIKITNQRHLDIEVLKVDANDLYTINPNGLAGAEFTLKKYTAEDYFSLDSTWPEQRVTDENESGRFKFTNLSQGYYKLVETEVPTGYVKLEEDPIFRVTEDNGIITITMLEMQNGTAIETSEQVSQIILSSSTFIVGNPPGAALPNTGGPGTNLIYLFGFLMTGLAGAGLVMKRRRRNAA